MSEIVEASDEQAKKQIIVGFGCKRRRGKDTAAGFAVAYLRGCGRPTRVDAFAFSLKEAACAIFGFSHSQLHSELKEVKDPFWGLSPRAVLQRLGTEVMQREFGRDIWVNTLLRRLRTYPSVNVVVTDVRFRHEFDALKAAGACLVRIDRNVDSGGAGDCHPSEVDLDDCTEWDAIIDNNGTLAALRTAVDNVVVRLL